ncbi:CHRD domain-containing protein [Chitinophaga agrisoli]|uniref:CHRD domain-containing protein n=1 Tax=Chitinophaga agrisoli TaxID=2607653 RepID=A0A5B2VYA3_9BACT|nr:CHRD domain-containing protein [Chitinophaga agrisoli]KAA2243530.1 CHRD domain-containing protein [Chitinophaga agrisoli]
MLTYSTLSIRHVRVLALGTAIACITGLSACKKHDDFRKEMKVRASLSGSQEVPPNNSPGTAKLKGTYNCKTNVIDYDLSWEKITGPPIAMHFHGPATPGQNAPVEIPITGFPMNATGSLSAKDTLTEDQEDDLLAGRYYVNIHTKLYPGGEIRGQVSVKH